jgi:hypothetical protein
MTYRPSERDSEEAIAYGWMVLSLFLMVAGILYLYLLGFVNMLIDGPNLDQSIGINHDIAAGKQSVQSVNAMNFNIAMFKNIPIFLITGAFIYAIARAIVVKSVP